MIEKLLRWWSSLQVRERRILGYGGAGVLLVLAYLLAFEPAWVGRQRLQAELPQLRGQLAQMEGLAGEAQRLAGQTNQTAESPQQLKLALEQSIAAAGL
jgi:general secretion pathway protein M